jgi:hypothetical protein
MNQNAKLYYDNDPNVLQPGQIEVGMLVAIHESGYDRSWIGDVFKIELVEGPYAVASFVAQWRPLGSIDRKPQLFDLRHYTFRKVSEEYVNQVKRVQNWYNSPITTPKLEAEVFEEEPAICCGEGFGEC